MALQSQYIHENKDVSADFDFSTDFDIDALIAREMLSEATDHIYFPTSSSSPFFYDSVSVHSAWSQQALSGCTETFASVDEGELGTEKIVRAMYEEGRVFRETIAERERMEFEEWQMNRKREVELGGSRIAAARRVLGLDEGGGEALPDVKRAFSKMVKLKHPDMGGSPGEFIRLRKAYILMAEFAKAKI